jgi:hypothetical protein
MKAHLSDINRAALAAFSAVSGRFRIFPVFGVH